MNAGKLCQSRSDLGQATGRLHHQRKAQDEEPHSLDPRQRLRLRPRQLGTRWKRLGGLGLHPG